jgi:hypothetical protein
LRRDQYFECALRSQAARYLEECTKNGEREKDRCKALNATWNTLRRRLAIMGESDSPRPDQLPGERLSSSRRRGVYLVSKLTRREAPHHIQTVATASSVKGTTEIQHLILDGRSATGQRTDNACCVRKQTTTSKSSSKCL